VLALRPVSKATGTAMACKLIEAAEGRWRAVNAPHLVTLVRAGARFEYGKLVERDPVFDATQAADDTPVQPPAASNQPVNNAA
jgi:putative transposase